MADINWMEILHWQKHQLDEIRITAYAYIRQGKYDIALPLFEALHALDPQNLYDLQTLGGLYVQLNNPAKALLYLDKALKLDSQHAQSLLNLAKAFFMMGNQVEGLRLANALKKSKDRSVANIAQALILAFG